MLNEANVQNIVFEVADPIHREKFKDIQEEFSVEIDEQIKKVYASFNGLRVKWEYESANTKKDSGPVEGSVRILKFQDMMIGFDGHMWRNELWMDNMKKDTLGFYQRLKPFDYYATEAVQCVCVEMTSDRKLTANLWIYDQGYEPLRLNITLEDYFIMLLKSKGIWGWQFFYTNINLAEKKNKIVRDNCKFIIDNYGKIFNDGFEKELVTIFEKLQKGKS